MLLKNEITNKTTNKQLNTFKLNPYWLISNFILVSFISIICLVIFTIFYINLSQPLRKGELKTSSIHDKVMIYFDNHGRAHIFAKNTYDLVFTQGYLTAQDRLFQMDLTRRAAKGELSEILGIKGLIRDKYAKDIGLLESAKEELKNSSKLSQKLLNAYSNGVTTYIEKHKKNLPIEFKVLNYTPKPWEPIDSIVLVKQLAEIIDTSWQLDLIREQIYKRIPLEKADVLFEQNFPGNPIINYNARKYLVFDDYILKKPNLLQKWRAIKEKVALKKILEGPYFKIKKKIIEAAEFLRNGSDRWEGFNWGSNCWVIGSKKSNSPILANDPHMELATPSFWYPIHLVDRKNKTNILGLSIPGLPGILIGHNGKIAWGITSLSADVQDLFVGEFKDENSLEYKKDNNWVSANIIESKIKVKNKKVPFKHKSIFTSCGPVLDKDGKSALILKWSAIESNHHNAVESFWKLGQASNWNEFRNALKLYNGASLSFHYVDKTGNIGYQAAGRFPNKQDGFGNVPILGLSCNKYWLGYIPFNELPHAYNPKVGYIVSANNKVVSSEYKYNLGENFLSPFRAVRISTLLSKEKDLNIEKNQKIQKDLYSWVANYLTVQILEAYYNTKMSSKDLLPAIQLLNKWDFNLDSKSPESLIFEKTYETLLKKILIDKLGEDLTKDYLKEWRAGSLALVKILIDEDIYWLPKGIKNFETLLLLSLQEAVNQGIKITKTNDLTKWQWGKYHTLTFEHPFSKALPILGPLLNVGPVEVGGDKDTISAFGTNNNLKAIWGPSARVVIDLKNPDNAHLQIPLGTSSQIGSFYFKDQTIGWIENNDIPFVYNESKIIRTAKDMLVLKPK